MELSRRGFLKGAVGAAGVGMAYGLSSAAPALAVEASEEWKLVNTEEYTNICCYCAGVCCKCCTSLACTEKFFPWRESPLKKNRPQS